MPDEPRQREQHMCKLTGVSLKTRAIVRDFFMLNVPENRGNVLSYGLPMVQVLSLYDIVEGELWEEKKRQKEIEELKKRFGLK